jgi:hypothetical protein
MLEKYVAQSSERVNGRKLEIEPRLGLEGTILEWNKWPLIGGVLTTVKIGR